MTKANAFFQLPNTHRLVQPKPRPYTKPPNFIVEYQRPQSTKWGPCIDSLHGSKGAAVKSLNRCVESPLPLYRHTKLRVRMLREDKVVAEANHRSLGASTEKM